MELIRYRGWKDNVRLANGKAEVVITTEVGPRIIRFALIGGSNVLGELRQQMGGKGEKEWMIRGGHRLWIAPEEKPKSYELDNSPVAVEEVKGGVRLVQKPGPITHVEKSMTVCLAPGSNDVTITHGLVNRGRKSVTLSPWALTVMAKRGMAIIPLPKKISHSERLTHNQEWSLWGYTDLTDKRWTVGSQFLLFRQDPTKGPNKLGVMHREGWVAYQLGDNLFVKRFGHRDGAPYPDGGVNFETFSNEDILELETLGPLVVLAPGKSVSHVERWSLRGGVPKCRTEADVRRHVLPLV